MAYVIYDKETTRIKGRLDGYKTVSAATAQITRWSRIWFRECYTPRYPEVPESEDPVYVYGIAETEHFRKHIQKTVTRTNMMTGAEYEESVNTPLALSPSSETYWSM
jgi:hypothetical protein